MTDTTCAYLMMSKLLQEIHVPNSGEYICIKVITKTFYYNAVLNFIIVPKHKPHQFAVLQSDSQVLSVCLELYSAHGIVTRYAIKTHREYIFTGCEI